MRKFIAVSSVVMCLSGCAHSGDTIKAAAPVSFTKAMTDLSEGINILKNSNQKNAQKGSFGLLLSEITATFNIAVDDSGASGGSLTVVPNPILSSAQLSAENKSNASAKNDIVIKFKNIYFDQYGVFDLKNANAISQWQKSNPDILTLQTSFKSDTIKDQLKAPNSPKATKATKTPKSPNSQKALKATKSIKPKHSAKPKKTHKKTTPLQEKTQQ